jgi:hypothetical protein
VLLGGTAVLHLRFLARAIGAAHRSDLQKWKGAGGELPGASNLVSNAAYE